jgi:hypothetical protein
MSQSQAILIAVMVGLSPIIGLATTVLIMPIVARWSGWSRLASAHPEQAMDSPDAGWRHLSVVAIRSAWRRYNNCAKASFDGKTLRIKVWPLFSAGHPRIAVPVEAVRSVGEVGTGFNRAHDLAVDVGDGEMRLIIGRNSATDAFAEAARARLGDAGSEPAAP